MQLVSLSLYSPTGQHKIIPFRLGELNIITGQSKTGKSVLVKLIDYCLGRSAVPTSAGAVEQALAWVGALWQFSDGGRAFVGRRVGGLHAQSSSRAMVVIGNGTLQPPAFEELTENQNVHSMRLDLGSRIGIDESRIEPTGAREPFRTSLGHAALLCLQNQDEISSSTRIFHRSGERGIDDALRDTIPYFLGAVAPDQALQRALLRQARRRLADAQRALRVARDAAESIDMDLAALTVEAVDVGLIDRPAPDSPAERDFIVGVLRRAARVAAPAPDPEPDTDRQDARRRQRLELAQAEARLAQLLEQRSLLLDESEGGSDYADALTTQAGRLTSLNLLPLTSEQVSGPSDSGSNDAGTGPTANSETNAEQPPPDRSDNEASREPHCPVCGHETADPIAAEMRASLTQISEQLQAFRRGTPARSSALEGINSEIRAVRGSISATQTALDAAVGARRTPSGPSRDGARTTREGVSTRSLHACPRATRDGCRS